jgi:hypothetical protein
VYVPEQPLVPAYGGRRRYGFLNVGCDGANGVASVQFCWGRVKGMEGQRGATGKWGEGGRGGERMQPRAEGHTGAALLRCASATGVAVGSCKLVSRAIMH